MQSLSIEPKKKLGSCKNLQKLNCKICGDQPTGYHYDVLSCNGCKTFFRRTIINNRTFKCTKDGKCQFNKDFRCACRACRFQKCLKAGMKSTSIQFPKRSSCYRLRNVDRIHCSEQISQIYKLVEEIRYNEESISKLRKIGLTEISVTKSLAELLEPSSLSFEMTTNNDTDWLYKSNPVRCWMIVDLYLLVEFAKSCTKFRKLAPNEQIDCIAEEQLLKEIGGALHVITQSFYSWYHSKNNTLTFPDGTVALDHKLSDARTDGKLLGFVSYYLKMYGEPVQSLISQRLTIVEYSLFKTICLFTPNSLLMSENSRKIIRHERERLVNLLRQYLLIEYGYHRGIQRFSEHLIALSSYISHGERRREYVELMDIMNIDVARIGKDIYLNKTAKIY